MFSGNFGTLKLMLFAPAGAKDTCALQRLN